MPAALRIALATIVAVALVGPGAPSARADDGAQVIPGDTLDVETVDLDSDGAREVVRVVVTDGGLELDAWDLGGERWASVTTTALDADAAGLLVWRRGGQEHLLAVTADRHPSDWSRFVDIDVSMLRLSRGRVMLYPILSGLQPWSGAFYVADLDGDGTDEVVVEGYDEAIDDVARFRMTVLGWDGTRLVPLLELERGDAWSHAMPVESDGVAGDDLILESAEGVVERLVWRSGAIASEVTQLVSGVVAVANGTLVAHDEAPGFMALRWPPGSDPVGIGRIEATLDDWVTGVEAGGASFFIVGRSAAVESDAGFRFLNTDLTSAGQAIGPSGLGDAIHDFAYGNDGAWDGEAVHPYAGHVGRGMFGTQAGVVVDGMLFRRGDDGALGGEPVSPLLNVVPIGPAGPGDGWVALYQGFTVGGAVTYLWAPGERGQPGTLVILPADSLLGNDPAAHAIRVELDGAVRDGTHILAGHRPFEVRVTGPAGSSLVVSPSGIAWGDPGGLHQLGATPSDVTIYPRTLRPLERDEPFERVALFISPSGRGRIEQWTGTFTVPPELEANAVAATLAFEATVAGSTLPGRVVTIDGEDVEVAGDGSFQSVVGAWPWARSVTVTASDPLGRSVSTIVDVHGWPWLPILAGLMTVVSSVVLYTRAPGWRSAPSPAHDDDATLEELDAADELWSGPRPGSRDG